MTVQTYHLRIFHTGHQKAQWEDQLDVASDARLGEVFVSAVDANARALRGPDYTQWRLDVHRITAHRRDLRGVRLAQVTKDDAGRTVVKRP